MADTNKPGLGIGTVLGLIFIVLKLTGLITWSWWWVLSPFLIGAGLFILALFGMIILVMWRDR